MSRTVRLAWVLLLACDRGSATTAPQSPAGAPTPHARSEKAPANTQPTAQPEVEEPAPHAPAADTNATPPPEPPRSNFVADGLTPTKQWPFFAWDHAEAFIFNLQEFQPGMKIRVYSESEGWNELIDRTLPLSNELASKAIEMLEPTHGQLEVSKCPVPRHAVVLFSGEVPVGTINICFQCGDIMIWPPYKPGPSWQKKKRAMYDKLMKAYDRSFPKWIVFFEKHVGVDTNWERLVAP
ncbi:MAG: hypothetical protein AAF721_33840 [Myxococcota bacterium]